MGMGEGRAVVIAGCQKVTATREVWVAAVMWTG